jgi:hypothetical protein
MATIEVTLRTRGRRAALSPQAHGEDDVLDERVLSRV